MSREMLNDKTFAGLGTAQPIEIPGRPDRAVGGVMTVNGVVTRAAFLLGLTLVAAMFGWSRAASITGGIQSALLVGLLGLVVLSLVTARRPQLAVVTGPVYAVVMGAWTGIISHYYEGVYPGIVLQAVFATFSVFLACLVLYVTKIVKVTDRFVFVVSVATGGILVMYVALIVANLFGANLTFLSSPSPLGILLSVAICIVAALNLFLDFRFIEDGVRRGVPASMAWYAAFGLLATLIWLYLEILRLLGKIRG